MHFKGSWQRVFCSLAVVVLHVYKKLVSELEFIISFLFFSSLPILKMNLHETQLRKISR